MNLNLKHKYAVIAGAALLAGSLLVTGSALAASGSAGDAPAASAPAKADRLDQAVADGKLTQAEADVIKQIDELRQAAMEKLQADVKAVIEQAVADGKITQEQADQMLSHKGPGRFGHGGFGQKGFGHKGFDRGFGHRGFGHGEAPQPPQSN